MKRSQSVSQQIGDKPSNDLLGLNLFQQHSQHIQTSSVSNSQANSLSQQQSPGASNASTPTAVHPYAPLQSPTLSVSNTSRWVLIYLIPIQPWILSLKLNIFIRDNAKDTFHLLSSSFEKLLFQIIQERIKECIQSLVDRDQVGFCSGSPYDYHINSFVSLQSNVLSLNHPSTCSPSISRKLLPEWGTIRWKGIP